MDHDGGRIAFSFRARLVVVMTALLLATLALIQYLNARAQHEIQLALEQQKATVNDTFFAHLTDIRQATDFALASLSKSEYLCDLLEKPENAGVLNRDRIRHILIVQDDGVISDASDRSLLKGRVAIPPASGNSASGRVVEGDPVSFDDADQDDTDREDAETYWTRVPVTQADTGEKVFVWLAIVVSNRQVSASIDQSQRDLADVVESTAAARLRLTLGVFVLAVVLTILLVWRFTRPISQLSEAADRVARGDLSFSVDIHRRDEMGQLARTFNGMIGGLKAKAELEDRLNNAERAAVIGRLTSAIAHEIRNPLNFINLSIDHVRSKFPPADPADRQRFDKLLGSIKEETARLNRLVTDVLTFGRPANMNVRTFDVRSVLNQVLALVHAQADQQGITIETNVPDQPVEISADQEKLVSCFSNIAINALQAMPSGGRLTVTLDRTGDATRVVFEDTGEGISEAALDRVFEPYYSTKDTGTGLGLAVTKKIVDEHGGSISVASVPGKGTSFTVELLGAPVTPLPSAAGKIL
ncbi:MAG TPA: ATP-binding protein [Blastocatellia bacterium]|nr:ATP-binding protein [Blastocatellia bacterium]